MATTDAAWASLRTPARRALRLMDSVAMAAWLLLAVMLLTVVVGSALGAFNVGRVTLKDQGVRPVPAQPAQWQQPGSPSAP